MKKIITALGNPIIAEEIEKSKKFEVISQDLQYQEAILDIIEINHIDIIILSAILPGEYNIEQLIDKIKEKEINIEIILFLEKEDEILEKKLRSKGIQNIFYHNQFGTSELIEKIEKEKKVKKEIEEITELISKQKKVNKITTEIKKINRVKEYIKELIEKINLNKINNKKEQNKIISILGSSGIGKSIFTSILGIQLSKQNKKVLILDFDILNPSIKTIFGIEKNNKKVDEKNLKNLIIKINKNLHIIYGIEILFGGKEKITFSKIQEIINSLKENYNIILIDTSSECYFQINRKLIKSSNNTLFLAEGNFISIQKSQNLLNIYNKEWEIEKEKINIIYNRFTENSIDIEIFKRLFLDYKVIGKIELNKDYNTIINQNLKKGMMGKIIEKEYNKIIEKLENNNIL